MAVQQQELLDKTAEGGRDYISHLLLQELQQGNRYYSAAFLVL